MTEDLEILHADDAVIAVAKPAGLAAHRSKMVANEDAYLVDAIREKTGRPAYLAHRLDRATSGVVVCGTTKALVAALGAQFMSRDVCKVYLAVVRGWPAETGVIDHPLDAPGQPQPKPSVTRWRRLGTVEVPIAMGRYPRQRYALLEVVPETGRWRQIRRHFAHVSHHLIGDTSHGRGDHNRLFRQHYGVHRLLLHAWQLTFAHPVDGRAMHLTAPLDAEFRKVLDQFGWADVLRCA